MYFYSISILFCSILLNSILVTLPEKFINGWVLLTTTTLDFKILK